MNRTFDTFCRQLGRATFGLLFATLSFYGITLLCGFLGFGHAADSFGGITASLAYVFVVLFGLFLMAFVVDAVVRWIDRRTHLGSPERTS